MRGSGGEVPSGMAAKNFGAGIIGVGTKRSDLQVGIFWVESSTFGSTDGWRDEPHSGDDWQSQV